jgi:hypothetical protein
MPISLLTSISVWPEASTARARASIPQPERLGLGAPAWDEAERIERMLCAVAQPCAADQRSAAPSRLGAAAAADVGLPAPISVRPEVSKARARASIPQPERSGFGVPAWDEADRVERMLCAVTHPCPGAAGADRAAPISVRPEASTARARASIPQPERSGFGVPAWDEADRVERMLCAVTHPCPGAAGADRAASIPVRPEVSKARAQTAFPPRSPV